MKRLLKFILYVLSSWAVPPVVISFFVLVYIGLAFFTDETLIALIALTARSKVLASILALIPLSSALRIFTETLRFFRIHRAMSGKTNADIAELFNEAVEVPGSAAASNLQKFLNTVGYKTRLSETSIAAWRGVSNFPVRILLLAGTFCVFAGILISVTARTSQRQMVIEGEPLPVSNGSGGTVESIKLASSSGMILARALTMVVAPSVSGLGKRTFGLYPPSLYGGAFAYPRYLGIDLHLRFSAPDLPTGYETHSPLNTFPPGKEANLVIPGSPYRIIFSISEPDAGSDRYTAYMTGNFPLQFKLLKGKDILFTGSIQKGGEFKNGGYILAVPDIRRLVVTDFVTDYGVLLIWSAALLIFAAGIIWLPVRFFFPRRELLFKYESGITTAYSREEGGARRHAGVFHEALDLIVDS